MQRNLNGHMVLHGTSQNTIITSCKIKHSKTMVLNDHNPIPSYSHGTLKNSNTHLGKKKKKKHNIMVL